MRTETFALAAAIALVVAAPALADHGKAGMWHLETQTKPSDPHRAMMYMPGWEVMAIKDAYNKRSKSDYCMTPEAVRADLVFVPNCAMGPTSVSGATLQADYTCEGPLAGKGHMTVTYDSPEHYTGVSDYEMVKGRGIVAHTTYDAKWTGDTCTAPAN